MTVTEQDALQVLRRIDDHFRRESELEVPEACRIVNNEPQFSRHRDIWKDVRRVIRALEDA